MRKKIRKLAKTGKNGLYVNIPREWLDYYNLEYGDAVEIIAGKTIEIRPLGGGW